MFSEVDEVACQDRLDASAQPSRGHDVLDPCHVCGCRLMLSLHWNALRPGDRVLVHDDTQRISPLRDGVVLLIDSASGRRDVAVRVSDADGSLHVRRPRRMAVHLAPLSKDEHCWRCHLDADGNIVPAPGAQRHG